ncbi:MAG: ferrochelatase [Gammaproteobacteria bacterium]|nr:ferrochelatase [Gammaproteobacteria bacterium]
MTHYNDSSAHQHDAPACTGILVTNLGTPEAPSAKAVRRFLAEFLSDTRVIELPRWLWWPILHGIILRLRPARVARAYQRIWADEGSPLYVHSRRLAAALESRLVSRLHDPVRVELGMRYGRPSIASALDKMRHANVQRLLVLPLYPQYSATTTGSTFDVVTRELQGWRWVPELRFVNHYHDAEGYIDALAQSISAHRAAHDRPDRLLFSFHGLPRHYFLAGDPYYCHCHKTARLVADRLALPQESWAVSFQSRFGPREWLKPYTQKQLAQWARSGVRHVQVICPGFAADCLETLEEIQIANKETFLEAGGSQFSYIPALNDQASHVDALLGIIDRHCRGWKKHGADTSAADSQRELQETKQRAIKLGAQQ